MNDHNISTDTPREPSRNLANRQLHATTDASQDPKYTIVGKKSKETLKRYTFYDGKSRIFCKGRWITGPKPLAILMTFIISTIPMILFWALVVKNLDNSILQSAVIAISVILYVINTTFMILTATTNPGIIPKLEVDISTLGRISRVRPVASRYLGNFRGIQTKHTYCSTCVIIRPPRTYHWYFCDNCVEVFDHHCPWISWCIGKRNYLTFIIFITSFSLQLLLTIILSIIAIIRTSGESLTVFRKNIAGIIVIIFNAGVSVFVLALTVYHYIIMIRGETTHENLKGVYFKTGNPFKNTILKNIKSRLFQYRGPDKFQQPFDMLNLKSFKFTNEQILLQHVRDETNYICTITGKKVVKKINCKYWYRTIFFNYSNSNKSSKKSKLTVFLYT